MMVTDENLLVPITAKLLNTPIRIRISVERKFRPCWMELWLWVNDNLYLALCEIHSIWQLVKPDNHFNTLYNEKSIIWWTAVFESVVFLFVISDNQFLY